MKHSFYSWFCSGLAGLLCCPFLSAAEPKPVLDFDFSKSNKGVISDKAGSGLTLKLGKDATIEDGALVLNPSEDSFAAADNIAFRKWADKLRQNEIASCFWIRFDEGTFKPAKNANKASLGLFDCFVDEQGRLCVKVFTKKTSLMKPIVLPSKFKVEYGKWYHVEFSYSMNERRVKLYVDGKFQMENDKLIMPEPEVEFLKIGDGFRGAVKDLKFYDAALESEELALSDATADDYEVLKKQAAEIATAAKNVNLKSWALELSGTANIYKANVGKVSIAAVKRLKKSLSNAKALADGIAANPQKTVSDSVVTTYVTPATTQALYLPYDLPENGKLTNHINVIMAQNEYETASVVVVPFKPVKNFTLKISDLKNGSNVLKADDIDIKLVKRWWQAGGAWQSYHIDMYYRLLTPEFLLNDDRIITTDDFRRTNQMLMHCPGGDVTLEISDFAYQNEWNDGHKLNWFYDAPTLQPLQLKESGRNQQYMITIHAPKGTAPGFYDGTVSLIGEGKEIGKMSISVRVLPFELPRPRTYADSGKIYMSHVNSYNGVEPTLVNAIKHNMFHLNGVASTPENILLCKKLGYPLDIFFTSIRGVGMPAFGGPAEKITPALQKRMEQMAIAPVLRYEKMFEKYSGLKDYEYYVCWTSESAWYGSIALNPDQISTMLHSRTHAKLFSHGMTYDIPCFSIGAYDMDSSTTICREYSDIWHAAGGRNITYADPFPGAENPGLMRRSLGLRLYKTNRFDGHMMHGYIESQMNEFTKYPGGDGDYRTFDMGVVQRDGFINNLSIIGYREGFDDVRYASLMKMQAEDALKNSKDELVVREAKRQLAWLERINGDKIDMDTFRSNVQYRILVLADLIKARSTKGK